jgi:hypothetical protein
MTVALNLDRSTQTKPQHRTVLQLGIAWLQRLWWHTKALMPILGIVFLTLSSLGFLQVHRLYKKAAKTLIRS